jgi:hypothetical protein
LLIQVVKDREEEVRPNSYLSVETLTRFGRPLQATRPSSTAQPCELRVELSQPLPAEFLLTDPQSLLVLEKGRTCRVLSTALASFWPS